MKNTKNMKKQVRHNESSLRTRRAWQSIITIVFLLALASCSNIFQKSHSEPEKKNSSDGKTYLVVESATIRKTSSAARAASGNLGPDSSQSDASRLTDLVLKGRIKTAGQQMKVLATASTLDELISKKIMVEPAVWELILYGNLDGIPFHGTTYQTIEDGKENKIHIILVADVDYGKLEITVEWANQAGKVTASLMDAATQKTVIANKSYTTFEETSLQEPDGTTTAGHKVTFAFDKDAQGQNLTSGTYYLSVDFYDIFGSILSKSEYFVNIAKGLTTKTTVRTDLSPTYSIVYNDDGGTFIGTSKPMNYNRKSVITLPEMTSDAKFFDGWYDQDGYKITGPINGYEKSGTLTFTAHWKLPVLYVSGTGDDSADGLTEATPLETVNKACEKIIELGDTNMNWTIYIMGDVTGPHSSTKKAGARGTNAQYDGDIDFGRSEIPATVTTEYAKSILLIGKTGLDANGYPQDMLNRGLIQGDSAYPFPTGNVLAVATTVPVTIKNLKITGGNNSSTKANSTNDPYYANGGGLNVAAGATVTLDDGVLITKNKAVNGGAVYNAGTLYMVGSAAIGDKTVQTYPQATVTETNGCSNEYTKGGGIYNTGTVYLGTTSGRTLEGGIYNSFGSGAYGGGLYNAGSGTIFMSSGNIKYNDGQQHGGGVYLESGTFTMTGGELFFNSTAGNGGGVFVNIGAVFNFGGGKISGHNANGDHGSGCGGGGVYIEGTSNGVGKMFMYGSAVIGNSSKTTSASAIVGATTEELGEAVLAAQNLGCNIAPSGAGILTLGELYLGYSSEGVPEPLTGGIYYNTAKGNSKGGGLYITGSYSKVLMNSGTIANNYAATAPGVYIYSNGFTMSSHTVGKNKYVPVIPQGIYHGGSYAINIDSLLDSAATGAYHLIPNSGSNGYSDSVIIKLTNDATAQNITLSNVLDKFVVEPFVNPKTGIASNWIINSDGKLVKNEVTINVSSNGQCTSIADAVAQMNDTDTDYIIALSGEITGPQTISGTVNANSITIKGVYNTSNTTNVPSDGINANLGSTEAGTALTIDTPVSVTLNHIFVKGGHGTEKDGAIIGGGLLLGQNARVCIDNNTRILQNITYDKNDGTSGYGAGVYISDGAKLYENSDCHITENTATSKGAGIYIAAGGCLQTMAGSGSYVTLNTFDTNFKDSNNQSITPCGGAVYIEDNATLEMFGAWYRDNCQNVDNCLGSGIYLSSNGNLKIKGHTEVIQPNVIYLQSGAKIEIADSLSPYDPGSSSGRLTARLMLESYTEGSEILQAGTGVTTYTFGSATAKFEIMPQEITGGQKQYWALNNSGQLEKKAGTQLTVSIPTNENDIQVSIQRIVGGEVQTLEPGTHFTGGNKLTFTATDGFDSYKWTIDGVEKSTNKAYTIDTTSWTVGNYVIYLEAKDSSGKYYSYTAQINVGNI